MPEERPLRWWEWCLCYAVRRWLQNGDGWVCFRWSEHIPAVVHVVYAPSLKGVPVEEASPKGEKRKGWAGVRHALFSPWIVKRYTLDK